MQTLVNKAVIRMPAEYVGQAAAWARWRFEAGRQNWPEIDSSNHQTESDNLLEQPS